MPVTYWTFLVGALANAGILPFAGFWSKDEIIGGALLRGHWVVGALLMGSTPVIDQAMAAMLSPGSVSALSYGNKLISGIVAVGASTLSTALLGEPTTRSPPS